MNPFLRTTLFAAFAFASADGIAKAGPSRTERPCIATIEAHEGVATATKPKAGCPVAVAHPSNGAGPRRRWLASGGSDVSRRA